MLVFDVFRYQMRILPVLLGWGLGSIAAGWLWWRSRHPLVRGAGVQFVVWGAIDALIGLIGLRLALDNAARLADGAMTLPEHDQQTRRFEQVLLINAALDVLYMLSGAWMARHYRDREWRRGMGWGIVLQGAFLFFFDLVNGLIVHRKRA